MSENRLVQLMIEARALIPEGKSLHVTIDNYERGGCARFVEVAVHRCTRAEAETVIARFGLVPREHYYMKRPKKLCLEGYRAGFKVSCYVQEEQKPKTRTPANINLPAPAGA